MKLQAIGGAHTHPVSLRQVRQAPRALGQIFLSPCGQLRVAHLPLFERQVEQALRLMGIGRVEDAAYLSGHWRALIEFADIALGFVPQVKLAPLPPPAPPIRPGPGDALWR